MIKGHYLPILFFLVLFLPSCVSVPREGPEGIASSAQDPIQEVESSKKVRAMNEGILLATVSSSGKHNPDYRIGPGDLLEVTVYEVEQLNRTVRVSAQGNINLPLLGILKVKGLTSSEAESEIRDLLAERYLQNPQVSVFIKEYKSQRISVVGAVVKPGVFEVTEQQTVLDMLSMAGGLKEDANQLLFVIRPNRPEDGAGGHVPSGDPSPVKTFVIDLEEMLIKGNLSLNVPVIHGDVINIPVSGKIFVSGEVRTPGGFHLGGKKLTLTQAIATAGGLKEGADGAAVKIFRYPANASEKEILTSDVYAIEKGEKEDLFLKENDIVIVPQNDVKMAVMEVRDFFKGIFGVGVSLTR